MSQERFFRHSSTAVLDLAVRLDNSSLFGLNRHAGDATWQGRIATSFRDTVTYLEGQLRAAIDNLRSNGYWLSDQADQVARAEAHAADARRRDQ